jgi:hypothetical protein
MNTYNTSVPQGEGDGSGDPGSYQELPSFTTNVEILRALELTADQFKKEFGNITSLPFATEGTIKDIDIKLMEEFKKVYSLGTDQLQSFIGALDDAGADLDEYSILYYISLLENGPYEGATGQITGKLSKDGEVTVDVFKPGPDIMGVNANWNTTNSSSPVWSERPKPAQDVPNDTLRKSPAYIIALLNRSVANASNVWNNNVAGSGAIEENTLPWIDKNNGDRVANEVVGGGRNKDTPVHGNLMVKDIEKIKIHKDAKEKIVEEINSYLGDKAFRLFLFRKLINYFNKQQNLAHSTGKSIDRKVDFMVQEFEKKDDSEDECINVNAPETLKKETSKVETDMFGRTFDSVKRREFELKLEEEDGIEKFELYTIKGQLGSGDDVESSSII